LGKQVQLPEDSVLLQNLKQQAEPQLLASERVTPLNLAQPEKKIEEEQNKTKLNSSKLANKMDLVRETEPIDLTLVKRSAVYLGKPIVVGRELSNNSSSNSSNSNKVKSLSKSDQGKTTRLLTQSRQGESRQFEFVVPGEDVNNLEIELEQNTTPNPEQNTQVPEQNTTPNSEQNTQVPEQNTTPNKEPVTVPLSDVENVVEITADEQEYLDQEQIVKAKGNVVIRFSRGVLSADEVMVNLSNRIAVAEGEVILKRGDQTLKGNRFEYYFVQDKGVIFSASGVVYQPNLSRDFSPQINSNNPVPQLPLSWQFEQNQPLQRVSTAEGFQFSVGSLRDLSLVGQQTGVPTSASGGTVNRLRFEAERVDFESDTWKATNIRITNDPFSPPELEIRADTANFKNIAPFMDELTTTNSRLVFDQNLSIPLVDRLVFDQRDRRPGLFSIGFDGEERGGLYLERGFELYNDERIQLTITPQFLIQRAFLPDSFDDTYAINPDDNGGMFNPSSYGLITELDVNFTERTDLRAVASFSGLDLDNVDNRLRAQLELNHRVGDLNNPYRFGFQYNFRERMFNGSLGFQTVQQSIGGIVTSPYIPLISSRDIGVGFTYQGSIQGITAETDRQDLLEADRDDNLITLARFQTAALLNGGFFLWRGETLPPTPEEGLKYTSTPVAPFLKLNTSLTGVTSYYSSGDNQPSLTATIGLEGQFGHFSKRFFDYTGFNISYSQGIRGDQSPFYFDRYYDTQVLSLGLTQQLYGPVRMGAQSFFNVLTSEEISTDYFLEYSRRTYNIILRYNPVLQIGSLNLRISDFNWDGNPAPFQGTGISPVVEGITR
jgi:hypothetical protein